ncbi:hypothetical protein [Halobellus litoreus]|uniref:Uncharacterized protein n=1 Tax=Halobellus litoreus TaxID=755310 RepID=A0ABD6DQU9_9EURY|nr:hypothetical protein [Halobellus litoreus]
MFARDPAGVVLEWPTASNPQKPGTCDVTLVRNDQREAVVPVAIE